MIVLRIIDAFAQGLRLLGVLALIFMALSVFYDTTMRYIFLAPTSWGLEVNSFLVALMAFLPAAQILRERQHLRISLLEEQLSANAARGLTVAIALIGALFCAVLAWRGGFIAYDSFRYNERMSTMLGTPMVLPYAMIPLGFGMLGLAFLANAFEALFGRENPAEQRDANQPD